MSEISFIVLEVDQAQSLLVVEYSQGERTVRLNIGYPVDDTELEDYIASRAPHAALAERKHWRTHQDVLALRGTVRKKDRLAPFTLGSL